MLTCCFGEPHRGQVRVVLENPCHIREVPQHCALRTRFLESDLGMLSRRHQLLRRAPHVGRCDDVADVEGLHLEADYGCDGQNVGWCLVNVDSGDDFVECPGTHDLTQGCLD